MKSEEENKEMQDETEEERSRRLDQIFLFYFNNRYKYR
jgi:hypothetical protein